LSDWLEKHGEATNEKKNHSDDLKKKNKSCVLYLLNGSLKTCDLLYMGKCIKGSTITRLIKQ
jgi:hypothetical protein